MTNTGDETMTGQAQEWRAVGRAVDNGLTPWQKGWRGWVVSAVEDAASLALYLNSLTRDLAQARAEAEDVAATAHMMGHASRNDEVRGLEAEVERLANRIEELETYLDGLSPSQAAAEAQLAQAREALNYIAYAPAQTAGTELIREARDALRRLQGGAEA